VSECGRLRQGAGGHPAARPTPDRASVAYALALKNSNSNSKTGGDLA